MASRFHLAALLACLLFVAGCGNKGPLYPPEEDKQQKTEAE